MRNLAFLFVLGVAVAPAAAAVEAAHSDLHGGVNVGMMAADLSSGDYKDFACVSPKGKTIAAFGEFAACETDAKGLHELSVSIDEARAEASLVAGHPVDLTLGFDDKGRLEQIDIVTKSKGPMFLRKKAYLLGLQAKARYGDSGWVCENTPLAADEEALGPTALKEHCTKTVGERRLTVDRSLFRKTGADPHNFTSESHVIIDWTTK
jgi:hypothetical protein